MLRNINLAKTITSLLVQYGLPLTAVIILFSTIPEWQIRNHWSTLFIFTALTIFGTFAPVSTLNARLTINNAVIFAGILLFGIWVAVWAAFVEQLFMVFLFRHSFKKFLYNSGQILLTLWVVGKLNLLATEYEIPWMVGDILLILVYWFMNTGLVAIGITHFFQVKLVETFKSMIKAGTGTYLVLMMIGSVGARLVSEYGSIALVPLVAIVYTLSNIFRQYYDSLNKLHQKVEEVKSFNHRFLTTMAASIDARDRYTSGHSLRVAHWGREIARKIGMSSEKVEEIYVGGILHDIGKIGIEDEILNKKGKLTPEEYDKIKQHTVIGYEIILQAGMFNELLPAIRSHHERIDGKGYPDGLVGDEIPLMAKILAISDSFDAMVADRPYRKGLPVEEALNEIRRGAGTQFDERLASHFIDIIQKMPRGELESIISQETQSQKQLQEAIQ
ncbi:HD-GYP domain-containing protein [Brevibacillus nitrificans]|uniref:HD-GYP domain-containing protein n=1 Tax=Brevibacillus nitrificans TaxID=651560 RepID=UPI00261334FC|nr:HD-GYP domain-containing protein [Brevibacillus nitrificans]MED1791073.1 HD-GYP domain-containing protein [Brevibacillus nitrificans]